MTWAEAFPNFLIGLREGLEGGLVVSILLAALRRTAPSSERPSSAPIWLGVLGAATLAAGFAAVLTFSTDVLSPRGQEVVGGVLSVLAVGLVTAMIFWMRRTAATMSRQLRGEVARAAAVGAGALTVTAFLAVGREGLETTLFLWAAVKASGSTVAPLAGAGLGLAVAVTLCWLLFRQAVRINLGVFFTRTALLLIVIAAGVLSYGLGDLQEARLLSGRSWIAFDLSAHVDPSSWWMSILTGVTELTPRMTVLQVVAWATYLAVVIPAFVRAGRTSAAPAAATPVPSPTPEAVPAGRWERFAGRRPWTVAAAIVTVPAVATAAVIAALPAQGETAGTAIDVTAARCAPGWSTARSGTQTFTVTNRSTRVGEINLVDAGGGVVAEIETLAPATSADLRVTLGAGTYSFVCLLDGRAATRSAGVEVSGGRATTSAIAPVTEADLVVPNAAYQAYVRTVLTRLAAEVRALRADLVRGDRTAARVRWLAAQLEWERVGASYNSFGEAGTAVDGLPDGLPRGAADPGFTGLHRLEHGLWHGESTASLVRVTDTLIAGIARVRAELTSDDLTGDPTALPLRAHEILEDAQRDHVSGHDDQGAGAAFAMTYADAEVTRVVLRELSALLAARDRPLLAAADRGLDTLERALLETRAGGRWIPAAQVGRAQRLAVNAALGSVLEQLAAVPDLLEIRATR